MSVSDYLPFNLPGKRGLAWIGGTVALGVVGVLELPIVVVLAALPVIDANVGTEDATEKAPVRRTGAATATAPKRATSKRRTAAAPRGRAAAPAAGRRSTRTRGASAQTTV
jgi:hypothetical protein